MVGSVGRLGPSNNQVFRDLFYKYKKEFNQIDRQDHWTEYVKDDIAPDDIKIK